MTNTLDTLETLVEIINEVRRHLQYPYKLSKGKMITMTQSE